MTYNISYQSIRIIFDGYYLCSSLLIFDLFPRSYGSSNCLRLLGYGLTNFSAYFSTNFRRWFISSSRSYRKKA